MAAGKPRIALQQMSPTAHICHAVPGRIRFRIPNKRRDTAYFYRLHEKFSSVQCIEQVNVNPLTGSLLLQYSGDLQRIMEQIKQYRLFDVVSKSPRNEDSLAERTSASLQALNEQIRARSAGELDFWSLVFLTLIGMSVVQLVKGNIVVPATTLLWYALATLLISRQGASAV